MRHTNSKTPNLANKQILIAEDNYSNQLVITGMLEFTKACTLMVFNGEDAVEQFKLLKPDLVLLDINMPVMDGLTACKLIRAIDDQVPLIAITANVSNKEVELYLASGFDYVIEKPLMLMAFYQILGKVFDNTDN